MAFTGIFYTFLCASIGKLLWERAASSFDKRQLFVPSIARSRAAVGVSTRCLPPGMKPTVDPPQQGDVFPKAHRFLRLVNIHDRAHPWPQRYGTAEAQAYA